MDKFASELTDAKLAQHLRDLAKVHDSENMAASAIVIREAARRLESRAETEVKLLKVMLEALDLVSEDKAHDAVKWVEREIARAEGREG